MRSFFTVPVPVELEGDGTSTVFTFDFTKGPYNVNVGGNNPNGIFLFNSSSPVTGSLNGTKVTVTFSTAPTAGTPVTGNGASFMLGLLYPGN